MQRYCKLLLLLGLFVMSPLFAAEVTGSYADGCRLYESGKYADALLCFQELFKKEPSNSELSFKLGRCAFETKNYELAVISFERILINEPNSQRVKLELARSYYNLGLHDIARSYFDQVLQEPNLDETVRQNIEQFLQSINLHQKSNFLYGSLSISQSWDSNIRVSPSTDVINTIFGPVQLDAQSKEQSDSFTSLNLSLNYNYKLTDNLFWKNNFYLYHAAYIHERDLNLLYCQVASGLAYHQESWQFSGQVTFERIDQESDQYLHGTGLALQLDKRLSDSLLLSVNNRITTKKYYSVAERRALNNLLGVALNWQKNRTSVVAGINWETEDAKDGDNWEEDEDAYNKYGGFVTIEQTVLLNTTLYARYSYQYTDYKDEYATFARERTDKKHEFSVGVRQKLFATVLLDASYTYTDSNSSIKLYDYKRNLTALSLIYNF